MAAGRTWRFKAKLRARAYGWRGSKLAIARLKEAASEIRSVAKSDRVAAGDGVVVLMERIWPAFQDIDTSSGALGSAVSRTVNELIPILVDAPADMRPEASGWSACSRRCRTTASNTSDRSKSGARSLAIRT